MEESEDNISADDIKMSDTPSSVKSKLKKRPLVERELETSLTARVTSPMTHGEATNTSRYGRARRLKTENDFVTDIALSKAWKCPDVEDTPVKNQSPAYKMHASNSPVKAEPTDVTPKKIPGSSLENQIDSIYNENMSLSRFGSPEKNKLSSSPKYAKVYVRKDLIQKREQDETVTLIKNIFSPPNVQKSGNNHLSNILERSSEKYSLNNTSIKNKSQNGYTNTASVVKTLDFDSIKKKTKDCKPVLTKSQLFELEAKCEYQVGDLAWARMGTYPFWPCIITRELSTGMFVKTKLFGRSEHEIVHVTFFGDNGRHSWIANSMLRKFLGQLEFEATREHFTPTDKKKDPKLYAAFLVSEKKMSQWSISVEEAETLLREPKRLRIDIFNDMLIKSRSAKAASKPQKTAKLVRTASDVSLSESLYDTLFSVDSGAADTPDKLRKKTRKSLDVSEVVTACLDNMAAKTGMTKIKRQSHMDRWLQKAKSKTPEKSKVIASKKPKYFISSKRKKKQSLKKFPIKKSSTVRKPNESRKFKSPYNKNNYGSGKKSQVSDLHLSGSGIGYISKVESLSDMLADELSKAVAEMEYLEKDSIETYDTPAMEQFENNAPMCESPTFTQDFDEIVGRNESETEASIPNIVMEVHIDVEHDPEIPQDNEIYESEFNVDGVTPTNVDGVIPTIEDSGNLEFLSPTLERTLLSKNINKDPDVIPAVSKITNNEAFMDINGYPEDNETINSSVDSQNIDSMTAINSLKQVSEIPDQSIEINVSFDTTSNKKGNEMSVDEDLNNLEVLQCNASLSTSGDLNVDINTDNNSESSFQNSSHDLDTSVKSRRIKRIRLSVPTKKATKKRSLRLKNRKSSEISKEDSFNMYMELRKDAIMDENPELTQTEIVEYLRNTFEYEQNDNKDLANQSEDSINKEINIDKSTSNRSNIFKKGKINFIPKKCTVRLSDVLQNNKYFKPDLRETKLISINGDSNKKTYKSGDVNSALNKTTDESLVEINGHESINDIDHTSEMSQQTNNELRNVFQNSNDKEIEESDIESAMLNNNNAFENYKLIIESKNNEDECTNDINQNKEKEKSTLEPDLEKLIDTNIIVNNDTVFVDNSDQDLVISSLDTPEKLSCDKLDTEKSNITTNHVISNCSVTEAKKFDDGTLLDTGLEIDNIKLCKKLEVGQSHNLITENIHYIATIKDNQEENFCNTVNSDLTTENKDDEIIIKHLSSATSEITDDKCTGSQEVNVSNALDIGCKDLNQVQDKLASTVEPVDINDETEITLLSSTNTESYEKNDYNGSLYLNDKVLENISDVDQTDKDKDNSTVEPVNSNDDTETIVPSPRNTESFKENNDYDDTLCSNVKVIEELNDVDQTDKKKDNLTVEPDSINDDTETTVPIRRNTESFEESNDYDGSLYSNGKVLEKISDADQTDKDMDDSTVESVDNHDNTETIVPSPRNTENYEENNDYDNSLYSNDKVLEELNESDQMDKEMGDFVTGEDNLVSEESQKVQQVNVEDIESKKCDEKELNNANESDIIESNKPNKSLVLENKSCDEIKDLVSCTKNIPEPIKVNGFHSINDSTPDFSDTELNVETSSINSEDSEPLSAVKNKLALKSRNKGKVTPEDPEFIKYMELRQDALMDEHPELNQDQIVEYMYKTWQYEENSKSDLIKNDEMEQYGIVKGLNDNLRQKSIRNSFRRKRKNKQTDEDTLSISSDISDTSIKKSLRVKLARSPIVLLDDCRKSMIIESTTESKMENVDEVTTINSDASDRSLRSNIRKKKDEPKEISESTNALPKLTESSDDNVKENVTIKEIKSLSPSNNESSKNKKYFNIFKQTVDKGQNAGQEENDSDKKVKDEFDPETVSVNSEESLPSVSKSKQRKHAEKQSNKGLDSPEFLKYLELRQDQLIDENPQLTQEEITSYLYKTWLYEESEKSDIQKTDDFEQANLIKGLNSDSPQPKKIRKKIKTEKEPVIEQHLTPKDKPKRKTSQPYYNEDLSDMEDEIELFDIFKPKTNHQTPKIEDGEGNPQTSEVINLEGDEVLDEVELYFMELTKPKPNLFKGLVREKVCDICEKTGNLVKCKGCNNMFHVDCVNKVVEVVEAPAALVRGRKKKKKPGRKPKNLDESESQSDEKSQDISEENNVSVENVVEEEPWVFDADNFEAVLEAKMRELIPNGEANYNAYSREEGLNWNGTIAGKCEIFDIKTKPKIETVDYSDFKCKSCQSNEVPICFVCKQSVSKTGEEYRQRCQASHCWKYFHMECLDHWPQTQFNAGELSKFSNKYNEKFDEFMCPRHVCHTCVSDDPRGCKTRFSVDKLARCVKCPATYHTFTKCLPAGTQILTGSHIVCPRHYDHRPGKVPCHVNTGWCFLCALGGSLICCEYCPTSFHAECLNIKPPEGGYMCEDCETGRLPLYGEMVWVKLGHYRWWPGLILHPMEIPENIMAVKHSPGEFVVRFFGQYDHYWVNRGRVFPFQEGDSGRISSQKSKIDADFTTAMEHAHRACAIMKMAEPNEEEVTDIASSLLPPHYVKLKVNKPVGSLCGKRIDIEESSLTQCECNPDEEDPCGLDSQCLNRMLLTECGPLCRAGDRCNNRAFEKRQYPRMAPYKTPHRGWGLKALQDIKSGQFVIEYVGELIDEEEFRRRMNRKHEIRDENFYFLTLDKERMIDAGPKGNLARFMNHCCEPNCETQKWTVLGDVRVGLFAMKDIPANSELTFNYNLECAGIDKKRCLCGAKRCSGYMGAKPKQEETQPKKTKPLPGQKRTYKKKKTVEDSPSTAKSKSKRPVGRPAKPRELTEIEKDLLIIKNATNGVSSDSDASGRLSSIEQDRNAKALKRKRVSFSNDELSSPIAKKTKLDEEKAEVGD